MDLSSRINALINSAMENTKAGRLNDKPIENIVNVTIPSYRDDHLTMVSMNDMNNAPGIENDIDDPLKSDDIEKIPEVFNARDYIDKFTMEFGKNSKEETAAKNLYANSIDESVQLTQKQKQDYIIKMNALFEKVKKEAETAKKEAEAAKERAKKERKTFWKSKLPETKEDVKKMNVFKYDVYPDGEKINPDFTNWNHFKKWLRQNESDVFDLLDGTTRKKKVQELIEEGRLIEDNVYNSIFKDYNIEKQKKMDMNPQKTEQELINEGLLETPLHILAIESENNYTRELDISLSEIKVKLELEQLEKTRFQLGHARAEAEKNVLYDIMYDYNIEYTPEAIKNNIFPGYPTVVDALNLESDAINNLNEFKNLNTFPPSESNVPPSESNVPPSESNVPRLKTNNVKNIYTEKVPVFAKRIVNKPVNKPVNKTVNKPINVYYRLNKPNHKNLFRSLMFK